MITSCGGVNTPIGKGFSLIRFRLASPHNIFVEAESSDDGEYKLGNYLLTVADCTRRVNFEFFLGTARHRKQSLAKLDLLINILTDFRAAVRNEATLIEGFEKSDKNGSRKKAKTKKAKS